MPASPGLPAPKRPHDFLPLDTDSLLLGSDDDNLVSARGSEDGGADHHHQLNEGRSRGPGSGPSLTRLNGLALVISLQIGSGIFSVPTQISQHVMTPGFGLLVWIIGGLLVWTGASSFIELGLRIPSNGGIQEYLRICYGNFMGFLFTWTWVAIAKPAANAVISTIFAQYLMQAVWPSEPAAPWLLKCVAVGCIVTLTLVNCMGATAGAKVANVFLLLKLSALGAIVLLGLIVYTAGYGEGVPASDSGWFGAQPEQPEWDAWQWMGNFGTALFGALFCYGGWETVGFVLGDMKDPEKDLGPVINGSMAIVIFGFFLMNAAFYICLPLEVMRESTTVAVDFGRRTIGQWGGLVFSIVVSLSAMGSLNSNVFATAKLLVAASHRNYFPAILANLHCSTAHEEAAYLDQNLPWLFRVPVAALAQMTQTLRWQRSVPIFALLLNGLMASVYVMVGSFNGLVTFIGMAEYFFFLMSVLGILVLRRADKHQPNGTRFRHNTWIGNPIIFAAVSGVLILRGVIAQPLQGLGILAVGLAGLAVFASRFGLRGFERSSPI
ncbi:large neutral amino acids transporter small subunit 1 [Pseudomassariella vexata]|uniref:Large neutral amino acids transporter small subunit 1 n=1 Tax=Pseudomassariella vexata TaxID=1141098 RepID=A0A1Y2EK84_9PEZI|nr:large neutral amino acids transporter small subunit 1 [Pseudomassariella vexata]ORY71245.1 large neutral amino acids transporter small subunit 1 [Pseudomassariella vexata]